MAGVTEIMIAVIYTGFNRYYSVTEHNHQKLKNKLREIGPIYEYWFTKPNKDRPFCIYDEHDARGAIQLFDLMWALDHVKEKIFVKLRTDIWLSDEAVDQIVNEVKLTIDGQQDMSFIGWYYADWDFNSSAQKIPVGSSKRAEDFIVVADRAKLPSKDSLFEKMNQRSMDKLYTGNKVIRDLMTDSSRSYTIKTHVYLVRAETKTPNEYDIALNYLESYGGKGKAHPYRDWFKINKQYKKKITV